MFFTLFLIFTLGILHADEEPLPDLVIDEAALNPSVISRYFSDDSCTIDHGCTVAGTRKLLQFTTTAKNIGNANLEFGDPINNPFFHFHECHQHYHFEDFSIYRLVNEEGFIKTSGKAGFCMLDSIRFDSNANPTPFYHCEFQGIQWGWADIYGPNVACQYVDITDVPAGTYMLELEVNPELIITESNYDNNIVSIPIVIGDSEPAPNDICTEAPLVSEGSLDISNLNATESMPEETQGECSFSLDDPYNDSDVWYKYTPTQDGNVTIQLCGSQFDTKLAVYENSCPEDVSTNLVVMNNDACDQQSQVTFHAIENTDYLIRIGGYQGSQGTGTMSISLAPDYLINDNSENAQILSDGTFTYNSVNATLDGPDHTSINLSFIWDIWFLHYATCTGLVEVQISEHSYPSMIAIYNVTTHPLESDLPIAYNTDDSNDPKTIFFESQTGQSYLIRIGSSHPEQGSGQLFFHCGYTDDHDGDETTPEEDTITPILTAPTITAITKKIVNKKLRLKIEGENFQEGIQVYINDALIDTQHTVYKDTNHITVKNARSRLAKNTFCSIRLVNPDAQEVSYSYNRTPQILYEVK